ncbi:hypothetical protein [Nocardia sp. NPDC003963]
MDAMRIGRGLVVAGLCAVAAGCGAPAGPPADSPRLGTEFTLAPGDTVRLDGDRLTVSFDGVSADSRCPARAQCVWEGDAIVVAAVSVGEQRSSAELHTSRRFATGATVGGYRIELVALRPSRPADGVVPAAEYRADLLVTES